MKRSLIIVTFLFYAFLSNAQMGSRSFIPFKSSFTKSAAPKNFDAKELPTFGLYGIGNTNTETFNNINSSGKLSGYIRPFKGKVKGVATFVDINFAFNVNASNTDSLVANTILFPDVGNNSFSGSLALNFAFGH